MLFSPAGGYSVLFVKTSRLFGRIGLQWESWISHKTVDLFFFFLLFERYCLVDGLIGCFHLDNMRWLLNRVGDK